MKAFLDVGVVRIQEYINRSAGADDQVLKRRRGASRMVAEATDPAQFKRLGLERNEEAYNTEGLAHLQMASASDPATAARDALLLMREKLRYAHLEASWAVAENYVSAIPLLEAVRAGATVEQGKAGRLVGLPPTRSDSLARRCQSCGTGVADSGEECPDCRDRSDFGGRSGAGEGDRKAAEDEVFDHLGDPKLCRVPDLAGLARLPAPGGVKRNHLATVYADGNSVGALFDGLRHNPALAAQVSAALDTSIRNSGEQALRDLLKTFAQSDETGRSFPAAVTTLAADDVLITVPAAWGWRFVTFLVGEFNARIARALARCAWPEDVLPPELSLTAGLVFSHYKHPIETAITAADAAMRQAKRARGGRDAAIGWQDLTRDAGEPARTRPMQWFTEHEADLDQLAGLPASQRAKLAHQLRTLAGGLIKPGPKDTAQGGDEALAVREYLRYDSIRVGVQHAIEPFLHEGTEATTGLIELDDALSVASWWWRPKSENGVVAGE